MTPEDDELSKIEADDALLSVIAANGGAGDDPAGRLLADIAETARGLTPRDAPGGGSRRVPRRRGGLWGLSLGVSIVVAGSGGLSAAATDRLPEPVQRFVVEVGQGVPPASAQVVATPTEAAQPSAPEPERAEPAAPTRGGTWMHLPDASDGRASAAWTGAPDDADASAAQQQWWSSWTYVHESRYPSHSSYPSTTSTPEPTPTAYASGDHSTAPTGSPSPSDYPSYGAYPAPTPYPQPTSDPEPSSEPAPTSSPQPQPSEHGHPSPSPRHTTPPTPQPTRPSASPSPSASRHGD